jgi:multidrug efflux pump subunit AcrB
MKALKSLFFLSSLLLLLSTFGCNTQKEYEKINSEDQKKLIAFAEATIRGMPETKITQTEKKAILETKPAISINYTGNKTGRYGITWNINQKTITYTGNGDITSPESSFSTMNIISIGTNPCN